MARFRRIARKDKFLQDPGRPDTLRRVLDMRHLTSWATLSLPRRRSKTDVALMEHIGVAGQHVAPAAYARPQAEIVLLAIALPERLGIEETHIVQCRPADVHAEPDRGRHLDTAPDIHRPAHRIDGLHVEP